MIYLVISAVYLLKKTSTHEKALIIKDFQNLSSKRSPLPILFQAKRNKTSKINKLQKESFSEK